MNAEGSPSKSNPLIKVLRELPIEDQEEIVRAHAEKLGDDEEGLGEETTGTQYHGPDHWKHVANEQLMHLLLDPDTPGLIKDQISEYVLHRRREGHNNPPREES